MTARTASQLKRWLGGAALGLLALTSGWMAARESLVRIFARARLSFALRLDPADGIALNTAFRQALNTQAMSASQLRSWAASARTSLHDAPLSPGMVRMLATSPGQPRTGRLLDIAERISRRDALMQLALIEAAVGTGRVDDALRHYDRGLSIYPDLRAALFPVLTKAIVEPAIRRDLERLAWERRPWMDPFLAYAARQSPTPGAVAALLTDIGQGPAAPPGTSDHAAVLAGRFVEAGDYAAARRLAMRAAGRNAAWIDRPGFAPATWGQATRPLTWSVAETESVDAQLGNDGAVLVTVGPGGSGLALFRVLVPRPGRYRFAAVSAMAPDGAAPAGGRWDLLCLPPAGQAATRLIQIAVAPDGYGTAKTELTVPQDCPAVRIDYTIDNINGGSDAATILRDVTLTPLR